MQKKIGVVLFQLGGPDSLDAIEPFLYNLFRDPEIIDFPLAKVGRPLLAKFISKGRSRKVRNHYAEIGGGSPIRRLTEEQAAALEDELAQQPARGAVLARMRRLAGAASVVDAAVELPADAVGEPPDVGHAVRDVQDRDAMCSQPVD